MKLQRILNWRKSNWEVERHTMYFWWDYFFSMSTSTDKSYVYLVFVIILSSLSVKTKKKTKGVTLQYKFMHAFFIERTLQSYNSNLLLLIFSGRTWNSGRLDSRCVEKFPWSLWRHDPSQWLANAPHSVSRTYFKTLPTDPASCQLALFTIFRQYFANHYVISPDLQDKRHKHRTRAFRPSFEANRSRSGSFHRSQFFFHGIRCAKFRHYPCLHEADWEAEDSIGRHQYQRLLP